MECSGCCHAHNRRSPSRPERRGAQERGGAGGKTKTGDAYQSAPKQPSIRFVIGIMKFHLGVIVGFGRERRARAGGVFMVWPVK